MNCSSFPCFPRRRFPFLSLLALLRTRGLTHAAHNADSPTLHSSPLTCGSTLSAVFHACMARTNHDVRHVLRGVEVCFPFATYGIQVEMMEQVIACCQRVSIHANSHPTTISSMTTRVGCPWADRDANWDWQDPCKPVCNNGLDTPHIQQHRPHRC